MDATSHEGTSADLRILYSLRPVTMVRGFTGVGRDDGANLNCSYLLGTMHGIQSCSDTMSCRRSRVLFNQAQYRLVDGARQTNTCVASHCFLLLAAVATMYTGSF